MEENTPIIVVAAKSATSTLGVLGISAIIAIGIGPFFCRRFTRNPESSLQFTVYSPFFAKKNNKHVIPLVT